MKRFIKFLLPQTRYMFHFNNFYLAFVSFILYRHFWSGFLEKLKCTQYLFFLTLKLFLYSSQPDIWPYHSLEISLRKIISNLDKCNSLPLILSFITKSHNLYFIKPVYYVTFHMYKRYKELCNEHLHSN